eukprot:Hpha_TRINITY_DN25219_c0_g1::TRINITY_DN25219_c0_g1_i1::g.110843::m.110843
MAGLLSSLFSLGDPKGYVVGTLAEYLGTYLEGIDREHIQTNLWQGTVECKNLSLRKSAIDAIPGLPFGLLFGRVRSLKIGIPWTRLRSEATVVSMDGIEIVLVPQRAEKPDAKDLRQRQERRTKAALDEWD